MTRYIVHVEIEVIAHQRWDAWEKTEKALKQNITPKTLSGFCDLTVNNVTTRKD